YGKLFRPCWMGGCGQKPCDHCVTKPAPNQPISPYLVTSETRAVEMTNPWKIQCLLCFQGSVTHLSSRLSRPARSAAPAPLRSCFLLSEKGFRRSLKSVG